MPTNDFIFVFMTGIQKTITIWNNVSCNKILFWSNSIILKYIFICEQNEHLLVRVLHSYYDHDTVGNSTLYKKM